jgi:hypothetical protein
MNDAVAWNAEGGGEKIAKPVTGCGFRHIGPTHLTHEGTRAGFKTRAMH